MSNKLLPCPFCGSEDVAYGHTQVLSHPNIVTCFKCKATIRGSYYNYDDREILIKKWNTRVPGEIRNDSASKNDYKFRIGDDYFSVMPNGEIESDSFWGNWIDDLCMISGNIFKTEAEAEQHKEEMLSRFKEAREKYTQEECEQHIERWKYLSRD